MVGEIAEMTAYIAQLEHQSVQSGTLSNPATPRQSMVALGGENKGGKDKEEVVKAKLDREKLLGYIVNAGNIDHLSTEKKDGREEQKLVDRLMVLGNNERVGKKEELPFVSSPSRLFE